jgi:DNA-binding transcriptional ArsR family regulator
MKKEVKGLTSNKSFYLTILEQIKKGNNPKKICEILTITKQNLNYYLRKLKDKGLIEKISYGTWRILPSKNLYLEHTKNLSKNIRGHAFIWKIKLNKEFNWLEILKRNKLDYKLLRNCIPRIYIDKKKIWLGKKTLTIYETNSYHGINAIESRKYAVFNLLELIKKIESKLKINLRPYKFTPTREHFALIKNELANQCNKNNEKIHIKDNNKEWLWIDASDGIGELETGNKNALVNNVGVQKWWNNMKETKFEVTPKFVLNSINQVTQNQLMFNQNFESHVSAIKTLSKVVNELRIEIKNLKNETNKKV